MLHKTRARNARPYGHGGVMRSYFLPQHCRGAPRAPVIGIVQNFRFAHLLFFYFTSTSSAESSGFSSGFFSAFSVSAEGS